MYVVVRPDCNSSGIQLAVPLLHHPQSLWHHQSHFTCYETPSVMKMQQLTRGGALKTEIITLLIPHAFYNKFNEDTCRGSGDHWKLFQ